MKFALALSAFIGLAVSNAQAVVADVSLTGGYTTLSMADFNDSNDKDVSVFNNAGASNTSISKVVSGTFVAIDAAFLVNPDYNLNVGPRVEYIAANRCSASTTFAGLVYSATNDLSLIPVMLGLSADFAPKTWLLLRGGIYAGYGFARSAINIDNAGTMSSNSASGGGLMGELNAELRFKIIPVLSLGLDLGYRLANTGAMVDGSSGKTWLKSGGTDALRLDFSGINVGTSLAYYF